MWVLAVWLAGLAVAGAVDPKLYGYEDFQFLGWNDSCGAAFKYYRYPAVGEGLQAEPASARIGIAALAPDETLWKARWPLSLGGRLSWDVRQERAALEALRRDGFIQPGYIEEVRAEPVARRPGLGLDESVKSTSSLQVPYKAAWPGPPFILTRIHYSPLSSCAFAVYLAPGAPPDLYKWALVRVPVEARRQRAQAHLTNALLLYRNESDIYGALEEAAVAAKMDPRLGDARYYHSALLAAHGRFDEALKELAETIRLDARYVKMAKGAVEFEDVRRQARFREAIETPQGTMPLRPR